VTTPARRGGAQIIPRPEVWRPGGPAPWHDAAAGDRFDIDSVASAVEGLTHLHQPAPLAETRASAVLVALQDGPTGAEVILTRRSWQLRSHRGEISFPGGRLEPGETPEEGALREAQEEIHLDPAEVALVGRLPTLSTVASLNYIVPVVGRLAARPSLRPFTAEVDRILDVPLAELARPDVFREERWGTPPIERPIYFFELADETIWGATARILADLLIAASGASR
jgi:8-oxo-dGTP pyrophosphatase MutT (NUDIX family)